MVFFGVYIPSKVNFEGSLDKCAGSIAATNFDPIAPKHAAGDTKSYDPEYPYDSPLWLVFVDKCKALNVLRHHKDARLREFPDLEQAERYVQFGFESIQSMKLCGKPVNRRTQMTSASQSSTASSSTTTTTQNSNAYKQHTSHKELDTNSEITHISGSNSTVGSGNSKLGSTSSSTVVPIGTIIPKIPMEFVSERPTFRGPTKQELTEFRKAIEAGDIARVQRIILDNPRYLISSGDTPTNLKEGYRYNAIHICAIHNQAKIAEFILHTVSDRKFATFYTGKRADPKMCNDLSVTLLDYYLNIPDKARSETPLHFAAKNGHISVIKVLTSYPECKSKPNKDGQLPKDIICQRVTNPDPLLCRNIELLLTERFYVAVLRAPDNVVPPKVGQPFSPNNPPKFHENGDGISSDPVNPDLKIQALAGPMDKEHAHKFCRRWKTPPRIGSNTMSPVANNPYISPMKSPFTSGCNRLLNCTPNSPFSISTHRRRVLFSPRVQTCTVEEDPTDESAINVQIADPDQQNGNHKMQDDINEDTMPPSSSSPKQSALNGLGIEDSNNEAVVTDSSVNVTYVMETNNNGGSSNSSPAHSGTPLKYFQKPRLSFPNTPLMQLKREAFTTYRGMDSSPVVTDMLDTPPSLRSLNSSSVSENSMMNDSYKERHIKNTDFEKGLEVIGRELAKQENVEWVEYWDFLDVFTDLAQPAGLEKFETYLKERNAKHESAKSKSKQTKLNDVCRELEKIEIGDEAQQRIPAPVTATMSDFNVAMAAASMSAAASVISIPQVSTPYTCVEKSVQVFAKRLTKTITHNINNVVSINDALLSELKRLKSLICSFKEDARFYSVDFSKVHSRFGSLVAIYITQSQEVTLATKLKIQSILRDLLNTSGERREHLECLCGQMLQMLEQPSEQLPDNLKTEELCTNAWAMERTCDCLWDINLSRKTSRRKRLNSLQYAHQQQQKQQQQQQLLQQQQQQQQQKQEVNQKENATTKVIAKDYFGNYRNNTKYEEDDMLLANDDSDTDEEEFFTGSDTDTEDDNDDKDNDNDECDDYHTPPESLTSTPKYMHENSYKCYIFGDEPTKRDLDVLNAIYHVENLQENYPHVFAWMEAMHKFSQEEMLHFPSPSIVRKLDKTNKPLEVGSPMQFKGNKPQLATPKSLKATATAAAAALNTGKRLFATPKLTKIIQQRDGGDESQTKIEPSLNNQQLTENVAAEPETVEEADTMPTKVTLSSTPTNGTRLTNTLSTAATHVFHTPLNKMRGLFSSYRDKNSDALSTPVCFGNNESNNNNNSTLNISQLSE